MSKHGANIYKRKDGRWEGRCKTGIGKNGKLTYKSVYAKSYTECREKMRLFIQGQGRYGQTVRKSSYEFTSICRQWLMYIKMKSKESTYYGYQGMLEKYILPYWRKKMITQINLQMAEEWAEILSFAELIPDRQRKGKGKKKQLSARTVELILTVYKEIFEFARRRYNIPNPVRDLQIRRKTKERKETLITHGEWKQMAEAASRDIKAAPVQIAMYTGIRIGELCGLKKGDIDFEEGVIYIRRTIMRIQCRHEEVKTRVIISLPKSTDSYRVIPLPEILAPVLEELCRDKKGTEYIFTGSDGIRPAEPRTMSNRFHRFLDDIGIRSINFHAIRHTFATICVENQMDIKSLSEILGHSNIKITLEKYVHSSMDFKKEQINRIYQMK